MPSRAYTSFLPGASRCSYPSGMGVNALSGLYIISTIGVYSNISRGSKYVSMPSRAYTSFLPADEDASEQNLKSCQCPLGLIHHFYLVVDQFTDANIGGCVNALSGLYIISTCNEC